MSVQRNTQNADGDGGDGRLILTASTANQPAWETPKIGYGC
jgi:hypothetical protein